MGVLVHLILSAVSYCHGAFVEPLEPITSQRSLAESQTRLPCRYQVDEEEQVVQVTWLKEHADGTKEQIITAHFTDGHTGRLRGAGLRAGGGSSLDARVEKSVSGEMEEFQLKWKERWTNLW